MNVKLKSPDLASCPDIPNNLFSLAESRVSSSQNDFPNWSWLVWSARRSWFCLSALRAFVWQGYGFSSATNKFYLPNIKHRCLFHASVSPYWQKGQVQNNNLWNGNTQTNNTKLVNDTIDNPWNQPHRRRCFKTNNECIFKHVKQTVPILNTVLDNRNVISFFNG